MEEVGPPYRKKKRQESPAVRDTEGVWRLTIPSTGGRRRIRFPAWFLLAYSGFLDLSSEYLMLFLQIRAEQSDDCQVNWHLSGPVLSVMPSRK